MEWFDEAEDEIVREFNEGRLTRKEFDREMCELRHRFTEEAEDAAREEYDHMIGR